MGQGSEANGAQGYVRCLFAVSSKRKVDWQLLYVVVQREQRRTCAQLQGEGGQGSNDALTRNCKGEGGQGSNDALARNCKGEEGRLAAPF